MPETPEQLHARAAGALQMPPVEEWVTFPFDGEMRPRPLAPPEEREAPRRGARGIDCDACTASDDRFFWTNERWRMRTFDRPSWTPVRCDPRAARALRGAGRPPGRARSGARRPPRPDRTRSALARRDRTRPRLSLGDGSEHLHWWFLARPARIPQLLGTFAAIWDDILPPLPEEVWRENVTAVATALEAAERL